MDHPRPQNPYASGPFDPEEVGRIREMGDPDGEDLLHVDAREEEGEGEDEDEENFFGERGDGPGDLDVGEHLRGEIERRGSDVSAGA